MPAHSSAPIPKSVEQLSSKYQRTGCEGERGEQLGVAPSHHLATLIGLPTQSIHVGKCFQLGSPRIQPVYEGEGPAAIST
ncbi:hypothetical protein, partial [Phenylobacterium aquaticum]|uniref:hypothetical protein n=1 Tax=Phenylobacterium aquaticum TaxID=1763816 RepID=UPI0026F16790